EAASRPRKLLGVEDVRALALLVAAARAAGVAARGALLALVVALEHVRALPLLAAGSAAPAGAAAGLAAAAGAALVGLEAVDQVAEEERVRLVGEQELGQLPLVGADHEHLVVLVHVQPAEVVVVDRHRPALDDAGVPAPAVVALDVHLE